MKARPFRAGLAGVLVLCAGAAAASELKISHQFPAKDTDFRHKAATVIAEELGKANVGLTGKVHPAESLLKAREQWSGLQAGTVDVAVFGLGDVGQALPETQLVSLPGLATSPEEMARLSRSPAMDEVRRSAEAAGVVLLGSIDSAGGIGAVDGCVRDPADLQGKATRGPGKMLNRLFESAGATSVSLAVNEMPNALKTGALDVVATSLQSMASFKLEEELKCVTVPGERGLVWITFAIAMSKKTWDELDEAKRGAVRQAVDRAVAAASDMAAKNDAAIVTAFRAKGVEITTMTPEQIAKWRELSEKKVYPAFVQSTPKGADLLKAVN